VFGHLDHREKNGYDRVTVDTFFDDEQTSGVVYIADETNFAFLGDASPHEIAAQIHRCAGPSGTNIEYVLELARTLRHLDISDQHVFEIEALVLAARKS
jgi:cation transport regulator ChaC